MIQLKVPPELRSKKPDKRAKTFFEKEKENSDRRKFCNRKRIHKLRTRQFHTPCIRVMTNWQKHAKHINQIIEVQGKANNWEFKYEAKFITLTFWCAAEQRSSVQYGVKHFIAEESRAEQRRAWFKPPRFGPPLLRTSPAVCSQRHR